ncbi:hypothetical protein CWI37_1600p0020 [Hamiltosporidium tvaerminnensis]|uniref:Uncharacterized protein n=1 Tax=Hamiltosporidium tvaerminnensis TaxID=1176355 RepID=A0A4V6MV87_9MICR|nr:hypothetical protein CWI37_1600p0020 [Hamiltosporidium tvaerminnensis]
MSVDKNTLSLEVKEILNYKQLTVPLTDMLYVECILEDNILYNIGEDIYIEIDKTVYEEYVEYGLDVVVEGVNDKDNYHNSMLKFVSDKDKGLKTNIS